MSYLALARKWRPRNFSELAGQDHVMIISFCYAGVTATWAAARAKSSNIAWLTA